MTKHLIRKTEQMRAERDCETKLNLDKHVSTNTGKKTVNEIYNGWAITDLSVPTRCKHCA